MTKQEQQHEALANATQHESAMNYPAIFRGFLDKGIPERAIKPRENVFTYNAWQALGRQVRKGEHGVRVVTFIECDEKDEKKNKTGRAYRRPWSTTVFHVSQTDEINATEVDRENAAGEERQ